MLLESRSAAYGSKTSPHDPAVFNRRSFPEGFIFGTAGSAYQYEGAANEDGRGPSVWDTYTHRFPDRISDGSNGDVAVDQYHRYKEDVAIMKDMNVDASRFSISWSRILPKGNLKGGVNQKGIEYYNNLINELLANGIQPYVTLFHWDLPQGLQDEYDGLLSPKLVDDFKDYADLCFKEYGDRVKHWITLNEPYVCANLGYAVGAMPPSRCSAWQNLNCTGGDSATEPYVAGHNLILAHAAAVGLYREKYQASQKGIIGITLDSDWKVPFSSSFDDRKAALRALDYMLGWFLNPVTYGEYPESMRTLVGKRLPKFTNDQVKMVKGSFDFIGLNYYTAKYVMNSGRPNGPPSYVTDSWTKETGERNGVLIGHQAASSWLLVYPKGIWKLLLYIKKAYNDPIIYITENGIDEFNNSTLPLGQQLADEPRISYYYQHLIYLQRAIRDGVKVKGFFPWSLLDNFEWGSGYTVRFGINYVDYKDGLKRYPKQSAVWFKNFLKKH
ncbi:hypothetical protein MLD38_011787 [Melastoma candidum]|nr:hypothetical protein MLD38_011787 [Melastoma candidum]